MNPAQDPSAVGSWWLIFAAIAATASCLVTIWDKCRAKPAVHEIYATKDELDRLVERHEREAAHLHKRISDLRAEVGADGEKRTDRILTAIEAVNTRLARFERDIGRLEAAADRSR